MSRDPPCQYYDRCGGCSLQHLSYDDQILKKEQSLFYLFGQKVMVHPAPEEFGYRSRMDFVFSKGGVALREKGNSLGFVPIKRCLLVPDKVNDLLNRISDLLPDLPWYDLKSHEGFLRYLTVRSTSTEKLMLIFTTALPAPDQETIFSSFLKSLESLADSIIWLIHEGKGDDVTGQIKEVVGSPSITEQFCGLGFGVGPHTFFQSNANVAERMFSRIAELKSGSTLDLYCGVGVITLIAEASKGVELNPASIEAAKENAKRNNIADVSFVAEDVAAYLLEARKVKLQVDTIIVDPPRTGLGLKVCKAISLLKPKQIIYMSCNPKSFKMDAAMLSGYEIASIEGYDMFPQTEHVELLARLRKR